MNNKEKLDLIKRNTEEIITEQELIKVLSKKSPIVYCGYEISGPIHLGHFVTITKLMDFQKAGFKVKVLLADLHTKLNKKTPEINAWKKTLEALNLKAEFVLGSTFQLKEPYIIDLLNLSQQTTLNRGLRSMQEVARDIENATTSQIIYPLMQILDVKYLKADVSLGGLDQRKIYMLGREESKITNHNFVAVHTPIITSLKGPGEKMSSSIPGSNISVIDDSETIKKTISKAYCPSSKIIDNPILQICRLVIFPHLKKLIIQRDEKFGGTIQYASYEDLEKDYSQGKLHPLDLKQTTAKSLEQIIAPIRKNFK